jgi:hypothetical protein
MTETETIALTKEPAAKQEKLISTCTFAFSDSRSCAMPRWKAHSKYCLFHAHQAQQLIDARKLGAELATCTGEFRTNTDLNRALGSLFKAVAENRIPPRSAAVLAYIGQLLQQNIPSVQKEIDRIDGEKALDKILADALDAHDGRTEDADENGGDDQATAGGADQSRQKRIAEADASTPAAPADRPNFADPNHAPVYQFHRDGSGGCWTVVTEPLPEPAAPQSESPQE